MFPRFLRGFAHTNKIRFGNNSLQVLSVIQYSPCPDAFRSTSRDGTQTWIKAFVGTFAFRTYSPIGRGTPDTLATFRRLVHNPDRQLVVLYFPVLRPRHVQTGNRDSKEPKPPEILRTYWTNSGAFLRFSTECTNTIPSLVMLKMSLVFFSTMLNWVHPVGSVGWVILANGPAVLMLIKN